MIALLLEVVLTLVIVVGAWIWLGPGPSLVIGGAIGLILVEIYGIPEDDIVDNERNT